MADNYKAMSDREDERREPAQPTMQQKYAEYKTTMDKGLDVVINKVDIIKDKARTVNATLDEHDVLLQNVNNKLQKNNTQLQNLSSKMEDFLESTSNNCLYIAIAISGFIFLLLVSI